MNVPKFFRLSLILAALGMVSGCGTALRLADSASTASAIKEAGATLRLGDQTIDLSAHIEVSRPPNGTGMMVLRLASASGEWPPGLHLSQIGFRPQSANYYFNYINVDRQGNVTRITSQATLAPQIELGRDAMEIRFRILRLVNKPYEVQVSLRDAKGQFSRLGMREVEQR